MRLHADRHAQRQAQAGLAHGGGPRLARGRLPFRSRRSPAPGPGAPSECASASAQIRINRSSTVSSLRLTTSRPRIHGRHARHRLSGWRRAPSRASGGILRVDAAQLEPVFRLQLQLHPQAVDMRVQRLGIEFQRAAPYCFSSTMRGTRRPIWRNRYRPRSNSRRDGFTGWPRNGGPAHGIDFIVADPDQIGRQRLIGIRPAQQRATRPPARRRAPAAHAIVRAVFQRGGHAVFQIRRLASSRMGWARPPRGPCPPAADPCPRRQARIHDKKS